MLPIIYGLLSALTWGAGDFNGGLAVKRSNPYGVIAVAHTISLSLLLITVFVVGEPVPPLRGGVLQDWLVPSACCSFTALWPRDV